MQLLEGQSPLIFVLHSRDKIIHSYPTVVAPEYCFASKNVHDEGNNFFRVDKYVVRLFQI